MVQCFRTLAAVFLISTLTISAQARNLFISYGTDARHVQFLYDPDKTLVEIQVNGRKSHLKATVLAVAKPPGAVINELDPSFSMTNSRSLTKDSPQVAAMLVMPVEQENYDLLFFRGTGYLQVRLPDSMILASDARVTHVPMNARGMRADLVVVESANAQSMWAVAVIDGVPFRVTDLNVPANRINNASYKGIRRPYHRQLDGETKIESGKFFVNGSDYTLDPIYTRDFTRHSVENKGDEEQETLRRERARLEADLQTKVAQLEGKAQESGRSLVVQKATYDPERLFKNPDLAEMKISTNEGEQKLVNFVKNTYDVIREAPTAADPDVYYEKEMRMALTGLLMKDSGGVRITGKSGTGKSHFTRLLVSYLMRQTEAPIFHERLYLRTSASELRGGTMYAGAFDARVNALKKLSKVLPVVLIIEELHSMVGVGTHSKSSVDFFQLIKEELADGRIRIIGNTTDGEWERSIGGDSALARRFAVNIQVKEPRPEDLLPIARKSVKENYGSADIASDEVLQEVIRISNRFDTLSASPGRMVKLLNFLIANAMAHGQSKLTKDSLIESASLLYNYDLKELTEERIGERLRGLEGFLNERLVGLDAAKEVVVRSMADYFLNHVEGEDTKPKSLIFYGDRGTGKTTLGESLAKGINYQFYRMMMSEWSAAGQVEDFKTELALKLRMNPFHVVLFDEIEKAHPQIQQALLRVADSGFFEARLSKIQTQDSYTEVGASKAIFIFATNAAKELANDPAKRSEFPEVAEREGLNRYMIDRIPTHVPVETQSRSGVRLILKKYLKESLLDVLAKRGVGVQLNMDELIEYYIQRMDPSSVRTGGLGFLASLKAQSSNGGDEEANLKISVRKPQGEILELRERLSFFILKNPGTTEPMVRVVNGQLEISNPIAQVLVFRTQRNAQGQVRCRELHMVVGQ